MKRYILIFILSVMTITTQAQSLMTVQTDTLHSSEFGGRRSFRIAMPSNRNNVPQYNVIYVLDADYMFDIIASTAIYLQTYDYIPPTAVVAVDYGTQGNRADIGCSRNLELNETGDRFYRYLNDELIPHINSVLPTSGFNTLIGHSYTATYLCYYLAQQNLNFDSYVLFAPECVDKEVMSSYFKVDSLQKQPIIRILTGRNDVQRRIAFGCELVELFKNHGLKNVRLDLLSSDHMSIIPDGAALALRQLYDAYWNLQKINENLATDGPIWDDFQRFNNQNLMRYKQPFKVNAYNISYFMDLQDTVSLNKLADYCISVTTVPFRDIYTLSMIADLLFSINRYDVAADYYERYLKLSQEQGLEHETWYARRVYALKVLADHFHNFDRAWAILEDGKRIFADDSIAFCYYQGILSANHNYRLSEGAEMLKKALSNESILKENFITPDHVFYLLAKIKFAQEQSRDALRFIKEALKRSPENKEYQALMDEFSNI